MKRWLALDLFKFIAVFTMLIPHSIVWWLSHDDKGLDPNLPESLKMIVTQSLQAICFIPLAIPLSAGISMSFMFKKEYETGSIDIARHLKRGFILIMLGFLMNILTWGFEDFFTWDVLQFVGFSLIVITLVLKYSNKLALYVLGLLTLITSPIVREFFLSKPATHIMYVLVGDDKGFSYFPFFPWFIFITIGILMGDIYIKYGQDKLKYYLLAIGFICVSVSLAFFDKAFLQIETANLWGPGLYQPPINQVIGAFGELCLVFSSLMFIPQTMKIEDYPLINSFSKGIMVIYIFHTVVFYHITIFLKENLTFSPTIYWIYCLIQILVCHYLISFLLKKYKKLSV